MPDFPLRPAGLLFLGDVVVDRPYPQALGHPNVICNLEGALAEGPNPRRNTWNLGVQGCHFQGLFDPLPKAVSLANNHIMDFGPEAFRATLGLLAGLGIQTFGAGTPACGYGNPLVLECDGKRVGILGYSSLDIGAQVGEGDVEGAAPLLLDQIASDIAGLKAQGVDAIVVYPHWGTEHVSLPSPGIVEQAHAMVDLGADLVVGNHAHCIQARETYRGKPIFYGLGNFLFPSRILPGHYDDRGQPTQFGRIQLMRRQQLSLGVEFFPADGTVQVHHFRFTGERVVPWRGTVEDITAWTQDPAAYADRYRGRSRRELFLYRVKSFVRNPRPHRVVRYIKEMFTEE